MGKLWMLSRNLRTCFKPHVQTYILGQATNKLQASSARSFSIFKCLHSERKYSEKHEWVTVENGVGTVGISEHAQEALGDIVYAQLPEQGESYEADEEVGALESVKAASELYTPVSGEITEKNATVENLPALINQFPLGEGWLFKVKLSKPEEVDALMTEDGYKDWVKSQE